MSINYRNATHICVLETHGYTSIKRRDASSSRRREHLAGSVLSVRAQEARSGNKEMRRIYAFYKLFNPASAAI